MKKDTNDIILETVRKIQERQEDIDRDMEKDRQHLQDINLRLQGVENQVEELRKAINQNAERVKNKVADVVEPIAESADRLTVQVRNIPKNKVLYVKEETRRWWSKIFKK